MIASGRGLTGSLVALVGGGWLGGVFSSGPSEAERAEKKRADAAIREQARMRAQMQLMEAQLRQQ